MKKILSFVLPVLLCFTYINCSAWGAEGHRMVAEIARNYMEKNIQDSVQKYLGTMTFEEAATWMDDVRKDKQYDYMKPWHYINVERDKTYVKTADENVVNELEKMMTLLKDKKTKSAEEINKAIKEIFHLIGDLHQPLHAGYGADKGGNTIDVKFLGNKKNLHHVWDTDIIEAGKITTADCLKEGCKLSKKKIAKLQKQDVEKWMNDSRKLLKQVYDFKDGVIDEKYIQKNTPLVKKQLLNAGIRLAGVLNAVFSK